MSIQAVILDVYKTLLNVGPPAAEAERGWLNLARSALHNDPEVNLAEFDAACREAVNQEHARANAIGIQYPEVHWPGIACQACAQLKKLDADSLEQFLCAHAALQRTTSLMEGAGDCLRQLQAAGCLVGIASNAQAYTLTELEKALEKESLSWDLFQPCICFWSYQAGYSKPNPHVFRQLSARLQGFGVPPEAALMVGDRADNDIQPATAQGWQTWRLMPETSHDKSTSGNWKQLGCFLKGRLIGRPS